VQEKVELLTGIEYWRSRIVSSANRYYYLSIMFSRISLESLDMSQEYVILNLSCYKQKCIS